MTRKHLLDLAEFMEHLLQPDQYLQNTYGGDNRGCVRFWADKWNLVPEKIGATEFYELTSIQWRYLFGLNPARDTSLGGTIKALREIGNL